MIPPDLLKIKNLPEVEDFIRRSLSRLLKDIHSPSALEDIWPAFRASPGLEKLLDHWKAESLEDKEIFWDQCCRDMERLAYATRPYCLRCGECCRKSSPTLYREDFETVRRGIIPRETLITLRQGEMGFSHETGDVVILSEERLKIREKPGRQECFYLEPESGRCAIYENRPLQCRFLECWNPEKFNDLSRRSFLSRKNLINTDDRLLPVLEAHEVRCSLPRFRGLLAAIREGGPSLQEEALEMISYDLHLRGFLRESHGLGMEALGFLFGRPLLAMLPAFGFRLEDEPGRPARLIRLTP